MARAPKTPFHRSPRALAAIEHTELDDVRALGLGAEGSHRHGASPRRHLGRASTCALQTPRPPCARSRRRRTAGGSAWPGRATGRVGPPAGSARRASSAAWWPSARDARAADRTRRDSARRGHSAQPGRRRAPWRPSRPTGRPSQCGSSTTTASRWRSSMPQRRGPRRALGRRCGRSVHPRLRRRRRATPPAPSRETPRASRGTSRRWSLSHHWRWPVGCAIVPAREGVWGARRGRARLAGGGRSRRRRGDRREGRASRAGAGAPGRGRRANGT